MQQIVITAPRRVPVPDVRQLWEAREVLARFGARDVTLRYRQTALGVLWVLLQPLLTAGIFTVVFGRVAGLHAGHTPYFLFTFAGMLAWNLFAGIVSRATVSLVGNAALVSKVYFPRVLVPLSTVWSALVDLLVSLGFLGVLLAGYGVAPGWPVLLLPLWIVLVVLLAAGIGCGAAALMVRYRDVQYVVPFLLQAGLFASPIAYAVSAAPARYRPFYAANPMTWLLEEFRWSTVGGAAPPALHVALSVAVAVAVFVGGVFVLESMERAFADVI